LGKAEREGIEVPTDTNQIVSALICAQSALECLPCGCGIEEKLICKSIQILSVKAQKHIAALQAVGEKKRATNETL